MMDIKQLQYLVALAREKHFTRAAQACHVTQPTLSSRLRQLEQELGILIIDRQQRYFGLTTEGERVLKWAHTILDDWSALKGDLQQNFSAQESVRGRLMMGVIPSSLPWASSLLSNFQKQHAHVEITMMAYSALEIQQLLNDHVMDLGLTYLEGHLPSNFATRFAYAETYALFVRPDHIFAQKAEVSWAEAATTGLCLLTGNMQNRRLLDQAFAAAGIIATPSLETNSALSLLTLIQQTGLATILPTNFQDHIASRDFVTIPLTLPNVSHRVGFVMQHREPQPRVMSAFLATLAPDCFPLSAD